jgi:PPK2 family polyphosphate:nucleotide phosphotransferase
MEQHRVTPGTSIDLDRVDPASTGTFTGGKSRGKAEAKRLNDRLEELQELFYADGRHSLLVVLQGMDASGKDGTIRHVFDGVNPQGVKVASFKVPTARELARDYLWRVHRMVPGDGEITIFNRSHYEDVLVVRVNALVPESVWSRRYGQINEFEKMLAEEGTTIVKFFLHISAEEQAERFRSRIEDERKQWKFSRGDLKVRTRWDEYRTAYEAVLERTSTDWAPWYVVPADRKWYRNLVVGTVLVDLLESMGLQYPEPEEDLSRIEIE